MRKALNSRKHALHTLFNPLVLALLANLTSETSRTIAQGSLTPPGAPAPTMKSLDQIEPRIPIGTDTTPGDANSLFVITKPGSYYLTTNVTGVAGRNGIYVGAENVTLDLMGFQMTGSNSIAGVYVAFDGAVVRNGTLQNWSAGVYCYSTFFNTLSHCKFENLILLYNTAATSGGLSAGQSSLILNCIARGNTGRGFDSEGGGNIFIGCISEYNSLDGFGSRMGYAGELNNVYHNCEASRNSGYGFDVTESTLTGCNTYLNGKDGIHAWNCTITQCSADQNGGFGIDSFSSGDGAGGTIDKSSTYYNSAGGISVDAGGTISSCMANNNRTNGIMAGKGCTITGCSAFANGLNGITAGNGCTIDGCTTRTNLDGIAVAFGCTVKNCTASDNRNDGIQATSGSFVGHNDCYNNGVGTNNGAGIHITGNNNRVDENHVAAADRGIEVGGIDNLITRNSVSYTSTNYVIASGNKVGVIVAAPNSGAISGNTGGVGVGTTDPWANFSTP